MAAVRRDISKAGKAGPGKARKGTAARPRHYGIERWVDFARGLAPEGVAMKMTKHAAVCTECRDLMDFCAKVAAAAKRMASQQQQRASSGTG